MNDEHLDLFQRGITVAQLAAADHEETGVERHVFLSGLIAGLAIALADGLDDTQLRESIEKLADFAIAWRARHDTTRAQ